MKDIDLIEKTAGEILDFMNITPMVEVAEEEGTFKVDITGENLNFLIGYRGESLEGLQTVLSLMSFNKLNNWVRIVVDINGYRKSKLERLEEIAKSYIDKVRFLNKEMVLPPMNPFERRHVHIFISAYDDITSESYGEEPYRKIMLKPTGKKKR